MYGSAIEVKVRIEDKAVRSPCYEIPRPMDQGEWVLYDSLQPIFKSEIVDKLK